MYSSPETPFLTGIDNLFIEENVVSFLFLGVKFFTAELVSQRPCAKARASFLHC